MERGICSCGAQADDLSVKIALTGASGFVGRHVLDELEKRSLHPTVILRPSSPMSGALEKHPVVRIDLHNPPQNAFELMGEPELLIHLAWDGLPNYKSQRHLQEELPTQRRLLEGLIAGGLKNLVATGSCLEYGMASGRLREDRETLPTNPYGQAKDTLRRQLECLKTQAPFSLTWARLFYLYGDGQAENSLLPQLRRAVERGEKMFNMSGGDQLRDYLPVGEAADYLVSLAMSNKDNGVVNVCSGEPISVHKLVEGWIEDNGWKIELNRGYYPYPDYEPMAFWGDREKLDRCLKSK
jgi:nucleoside-diphosphate-sugar epimerase